MTPISGGRTLDRFIALYRGINVGGRNLVKMESLRAMHERLGHRGVASYIQSGNIVFTATGSAETIARKSAVEFVKEFGFPAQVVVVTAASWGAIVRDNPFAKVAAKLPKTVHVGVCNGEPSAVGLKALLAKTGGSERFVTRNTVVYLHVPDGVWDVKIRGGDGEGLRSADHGAQLANNGSHLEHARRC